jgi:hypothetical protein
VVGEGDDLDGVLTAALVHDRVRKAPHHVVVHHSGSREALDERPALRRVGDRVEGRADRVEEASTDMRVSLVVEAGALADVLERLLGDEQVQLSAPTETVLDLSASFRPRDKFRASFFDVTCSLLELAEPSGVEAAVGATVEAVEELVGHPRALGRLELERCGEDFFRGHVDSLSFFAAAGRSVCRSATRGPAATELTVERGQTRAQRRARCEGRPGRDGATPRARRRGPADQPTVHRA